MGKENEYIAVITRNGFPEALYSDFLNKNLEFKKEWEKRMKKEYFGCSFKEADENEVKKETERYESYYEKEKEKSRKEIKDIQKSKEELTEKIKQKIEIEKINTFTENKKEKENEENEENEEKENEQKKSKTTRNRTVIRKRKAK